MRIKTIFSCVSVVLALLLSACGNPASGSLPSGKPDTGETGSSQVTGTYTGTKNKVIYTLITSFADSRTAVGDTYIFTVKESGSEQKGSGTILTINDNVFELKPALNGAPSFEVTVNGSRIILIGGTITFDDGSAMTGPGSFTSGGGGGGGGGGGQSATVPVTGVSLNASASIVAGASETLVPTITPVNATNQNVTWSSDNTAVATVSTSGVVTGVSAGTAVITVTTVDGGKTATCDITVQAVAVSGKDKIEYYWVDEHGSLVTTGGNAATIAVDETITITAQSTGYTVWRWFLDGTNTNQSGNTFIFSSAETGKHIVGLFVEKNGKLYNTNITITVQE